MADNIYLIKKEKLNRRKRMIREIRGNFELYLLVLIPVIYILLFKYYPMYGAQIAFRKYNLTKGISGSPYVGFKYFIQFFESYNFKMVMFNTIGISLYNLVAGFPVPIILALMLNYCYSNRFKKTVQMVTYAPHFISTVVMCGMILQFLAPRYGIVNQFIGLFGIEEINFMGKPELFKSIFVFSGIWQSAGWSSIIYLATLASVPPELHEAAIVDGANKFQRIFHIDIPGILPTAIILLILSVGQLLNVGFEKVLLLQNNLNLSSSEIIQTYVYKTGIASDFPNFSYSTAIGLFASFVSFVLLVVVNQIASRIGNTSLW